MAEPSLNWFLKRKSSCVEVVNKESFKPGIYLKLLKSTTESASKLDTKFNEFLPIRAARGVSVDVSWGLIETAQGVFDWSFTDDIVARAEALSADRGDPFYVTFIVSWREFFPEKDNRGVSHILPSYLAGSSGLYTNDSDWEHELYDNAYAYKQSNNTGKFGYNLKLWKPEVQAAFNNFMKAFAERYDENQTVVCLRTEETATGGPAVLPSDYSLIGYDRTAQEQGQVEYVSNIREHFKYTRVSVMLNFSRDSLKDNWTNEVLENLRINVSCPNGNYQPGLIVTGDTPGILTKYPSYDGLYMLSVGCQGDDYRDDEKQPNNTLRPSYESIYLRARDVLKVHEIEFLIQSSEWYGTGVANVPGQGSLQDFLKTYPDIINGGASAGLNTVKPLYY